MPFENFLLRICPDQLKHCFFCKGARRPPMQKMSYAKVLSEVDCGKTVYITGVTGCRHSENRLRSMGLFVGDSIIVLNNSGSVLVAKGDNRIVLGAGLAEKIKITPY